VFFIGVNYTIFTTNKLMKNRLSLGALPVVVGTRDFKL